MAGNSDVCHLCNWPQSPVICDPATRGEVAEASKGSVATCISYGFSLYMYMIWFLVCTNQSCLTPFFIPSLGISQVDEESHEISSPCLTETSTRLLGSEYQPSNSKFSE